MPIYYEDQQEWQPADFYALWRYLNKMLQNVKGRRTEEIQRIDPDRLSNTTCHLMATMLRRQSRLETFLAQFPHLVGIAASQPPEQPLYLDEKPRFLYPEYTAAGIYL